MSSPLDWNAKTIAEFRANEGRVGGEAPTNPDWYHNLTAAGDGSAERGTETYEVTVSEVTGAERDRIYAEQARRYPGFAETNARLLESAPFPCSNSGGRSPPLSGLDPVGADATGRGGDSCCCAQIIPFCARAVVALSRLRPVSPGR